MTLDEAIKHAEEVMTENLEKTKGRNASDPIAINCFECAEEHRQLAEWLKELKAYREQSGDAISRQAVLEGLRTCYDTETKEYSDGSQWINYEDAVAEMENLPSVTPQPCEDAISRREALNAITMAEVRWQAVDNVNKLPLDKIRAEIEQAADKQFQIAMGVSDLNERYAHIQMENAYRHSLSVIDKYKTESEE